MKMEFAYLNTFLSVIYRLFKINRQQTDDDDPPLLDNRATDDDIIIRPETASRAINTSSTSGNNILNSNLSGSFREENETISVNNENTSRRSPARRAHRSAPNILQPSTSSDSARQIGVAALPNNTNIQFLTRERNGFI